MILGPAYQVGFRCQYYLVEYCIGNGLDGLFYRIPYGSNYSECLFSSLVTLQSLRLLVYSSPKNFPSDEAKYFEFSGKFTIDVLSSSGE